MEMSEGTDQWRAVNGTEGSDQCRAVDGTV